MYILTLYEEDGLYYYYANGSLYKQKSYGVTVMKLLHRDAEIIKMFDKFFLVVNNNSFREIKDMVLCDSQHTTIIL